MVTQNNYGLDTVRFRYSLLRLDHQPKRRKRAVGDSTLASLVGIKYAAPPDGTGGVG